MHIRYFHREKWLLYWMWLTFVEVVFVFVGIVFVHIAVICRLTLLLLRSLHPEPPSKHYTTLNVHYYYSSLLLCQQRVKCLTSFKATNSASKATKSPFCGSSSCCRGRKSSFRLSGLSNAVSLTRISGLDQVFTAMGKWYTIAF